MLISTTAAFGSTLILLRLSITAASEIACWIEEKASMMLLSVSAKTEVALIFERTVNCGKWYRGINQSFMNDF